MRQLPPDDEGPWATEDDDPADLPVVERRTPSELVVGRPARGVSLHEVLSDLAHGYSRGADDPTQIAVRFVPPGFRGVMGELARYYRVSYSGLTREALDIGIGILDREPWIMSARRAYNDNRASAMSGGDPEALTRMDQRVHYQFQRSQPYRTTLAASRETAARVAELAMACGIHTPALGVLTILISVLGLPNRRGYRGVFIAEVEGFRRYVDRHTRVLRLGE